MAETLDGVNMENECHGNIDLAWAPQAEAKVILFVSSFFLMIPVWSLGNID